MSTTANLEATRIAVSDWYAEQKLASLKLPNRWIGGDIQPGLVQLTGISVLGHKLLIELDEQLLLVFTDPEMPRVSPREIVFSDYRQLVFDWQEFGSMKPNAEVFVEGAVLFVAQPGYPRISG